MSEEFLLLFSAKEKKIKNCQELLLLFSEEKKIEKCYIILMRRKILDHLPVLLLFLITLILAFQNYTPGTFLSGWDTLHPEFDFGLNFQRLIFGVFRPEQGLGAIAAHSHMSDLPRVILLYIADIILPLSTLRYSYVFLNLILGPIGMYYFLQKVVLKSKTASFLGGLFYLLNLGTVQQFIVPFEMFITQYGMLPFLFLCATKYLESAGTNKKALLLFAIVTLLASPMAYAATLWHTSFLVFVIYIFSYSLISHGGLSLIKKSLFLIFLSILINSFWILPNIYFIFTSGESVRNANINLLFSQQAFLYNREFGNLKDIALLKNFLFDWGVYTGGNHFGNLLQDWITYLNKPYILLIGFFFAAISTVGVIYSIIKKNKVGISFIPVLLFVLFFLLNDNPPTSFIYNFFQEKIPLFKEAMRFPGDKVLGLFILVFALYFGLGQMALVGLIKKLPSFTIKPGIILQTLIISGLLIFYMLPAFSGSLISPFMRIKIPGYYFDVFSYFDKQSDNGRIADLPIHSPWGWSYYDWGEGDPSYQGAGFIWFGIKQPILNRDFDRWNPGNEQYFREMSHAVYSKRTDLLKQVIGKYNIDYLLLDESVIAPENDPGILYNDELEGALSKLEKENLAKLDAEFGKVKIYKVLSAPNVSYLINQTTTISPKAKAYFEDPAYKKYGDYIASERNPEAVFYPFRDLIDPQSHILPERIKISQEGALLSFQSKENLSPSSFIESENYIASDLFVERGGNTVTTTIYPRLPYKNSANSVIPITVSSNIDAKSFIVSVNGTNNFAIDNIEENAPFSLGTVFLNTKKDNSISIYPKEPDKSVSPDFSDLNLYLAPCEGKSPDQVVGIDKTVGGFTIFGKNAPVCMTAALPSLIPEGKELNSTDVLLTSSFVYTGKPSSYMCIANIKTGTCLSYNYRNINAGKFPINLSYFGIGKDSFSNISIKVFLDATQTDNIEKAKYSNIVFSLTKPIFSTIVTGDFIRQSIEKAISDSGNKNVVIPYSGERQLSQDITKLPRTSIYCNPNSPLSHKISKKIVSQDKNKYIRYESELGTACDHFSYQNLSQDQGYLLSITSRNLEGLPFTMCVLNHASKHCDLYTNLSKSREFATDTFLIPPMQGGKLGYDVDIASLGVKGTKSVNDLSQIQFIPLPYYFLSQMEEGAGGSMSEKIAIVDQKSINPSLYTLNLNDIKPDTTLVFSKSYLPGWSAYSMANGQSAMVNGLKQALPFFFGKKLNNHVLVNNWANGWQINKLTNQQINQSTIIIVYLPQYLEYFGLILSIGALVFILFRNFKHREPTLEAKNNL